MSEGHGTGAGRIIIYRGDDPQEYILQLERELTAEREKIACIEMDRDHARLDAKTERERADRNQEDADRNQEDAERYQWLRMNRLWLKANLPMIHAGEFDAAIDAARRK